MLKITAIRPGQGEPKIFTIEPEKEECLIARTPNAAIFLEDLAVSRRHAKIFDKNGNYYLVDLASTGGTLLNNSAIEPNKEYLLRLGDSIRVGEFILLISEMATSQLSSETVLAPAIKTTVPNIKPTSSEPKEGPDWWQKGEIKVRCVKILEQTADAKSFLFMREGILFKYKPGQFVNLILDIDGEEITRSYSLSSTPSRPHLLEITVKRVPRGKVSNWLHDNLKVGDEVLIEGPNGKFTCTENTQPKLLMISAGSGITPMMSMSRWLLDTVSNRDIVFFHSARNPRDIIFRQELELMAAQNPNFCLLVSITRPEPGDVWLSLRGRLNSLMLQTIAPDFRERIVYVCGPQEFMGTTKQMLQELQFPMENYYEESFGSKSASVPTSKQTTPVPTVELKPDISKQGLRSMIRGIKAPWERPALEENNEPEATKKTLPRIPGVNIAGSSQVVFQKSGQEVVWEEGESILEMAEREGIKIRSSCRSGTCGSCKKKKISGEVELRAEPEGLEPEEIAEGYILTCISTPVGKVTIDA
jgi:ferredoxin-NADP reductase